MWRNRAMVPMLIYDRSRVARRARARGKIMIVLCPQRFEKAFEHPDQPKNTAIVELLALVFLDQSANGLDIEIFASQKPLLLGKFVLQIPSHIAAKPLGQRHGKALLRAIKNIARHKFAERALEKKFSFAAATIDGRRQAERPVDECVIQHWNTDFK